MFRLGKQRCCALGVLPAVDAGRRILQALGELFGLLQQLAASLQRVVLPRLQICAGDLLDLVFERFHSAELLALVHTQPLDLAAQGKHILVLLPVIVQ